MSKSETVFYSPKGGKESDMELTVKQVIKAFEENEWKDTEIICPDGTKAVVAPCGWDIKRIEDCDYFLIYWDMPWGCEHKVEKLVETLNKHAELLAENHLDKAPLLQYFTDHQASGWDEDSWSFYSDWHKDIFGYRPHGKVFGEYINPHAIQSTPEPWEMEDIEAAWVAAER